MENTRTQRFTASPFSLARQAIGSPRDVAAKLARFSAAARSYADSAELDARLAKLKARGLVDEIPTKVQLAVGGYDMFRFWVAPASAEYYRQRGIHFGFHQVLRILDEPASLLDPVGFFSTRDGIIGHVMQVVHANPLYDLELLQMFDDGLDELERQIEQMLAGTHPRAASIGAIVEEPTYHAGLLAYVKAYRRDASAPPILRSNVASSPVFSKMEKTFGSLRTSMRYFCRMPTTRAAALRHAREVRSFPMRLGEPG
jgi:hypothetical protein